MNTNESDARYLSMTLEQVEALPDDELQEYHYAYNRHERAKELAAQEAYANRKLAKSLGFQDENDELDLLGVDYHKIDHAELARSTEESRAKLQKYYAEQAEQERQDQMNAAAVQFVRSHPEYLPLPENLAAFNAEIEAMGAEVRTKEDLEIIYERLQEKGAVRLDENMVRQQQFMRMQAQEIARALRSSKESEAGEIENMNPEAAREKYTQWSAGEEELKLKRAGLIPTQRNSSGLSAK
jgi:hypothetical protein